MYLTLQEWNARQRRPRSLETVRRWVRECRIFPPPVKDGREYLFHESAVKVDLNRPVTGSLLKNGQASSFIYRIATLTTMSGRYSLVVQAAHFYCCVAL